MARRTRVSGQSASWQATTAYSLLSGLLLWASFPPVGIFWLAWLAPIPWLRLIERADLGPRAWRTLWATSLIYWLATLQGIRLAHWLNHFGWLTLSAYLAVYLPLFVALSRWAVRRLRVSLVLVAPVVWTGLELARGYLFTGFSMALLGHTQYERLHWIQIADLGGAYAVSFLVMLVAASLLQVWSRPDLRGRLWPAMLILAALAATWGYGSQRQAAAAGGQPPAPRLKVALLQAVFNTRFEFDPQRDQETFIRYLELCQQVSRQHPDLDLIVWPESVFSGGDHEVLVETGGGLPPHIDPARLASSQADFKRKLRVVAASVNGHGDAEGDPQSANRGGTHLLVGTTTYVIRSLEPGTRPETYNSALLIDPQGNVTQRYFKMHPVMFGEYFPFGRWFPWIYEWIPLPGLTPGESPAALRVGEAHLSPSICFESAVPHLIRRQVDRLASQGTAPDVLVNLTHDGWFWGSSILDFQLAGAVFRAVELRRPCLVAANAGISAWVDADGRILARGPRQGEARLVADVEIRPRGSLYAATGDWFAGLCLLATTLLAFAAGWSRWAERGVLKMWS